MDSVSSAFLTFNRLVLFVGKYSGFLDIVGIHEYAVKRNRYIPMNFV